MTRMHFQAAADQVKAILAGAWTSRLPDWADYRGDLIEVEIESAGNVSPHYVRAVWTAEAYMLLFRSFNYRFDEARFLKACGLK